MLTTQQRARVDKLLDELLDQPEARRQELLRLRATEDPAVLEEVASLLRASHAAGAFLSAPARLSASEAAPDEELLQQFGAWRITRRIGRGGMGEVFEAMRAHGGFEQRVALKLLQQGAGEQLERFQAERQILARLEHPGIARLHDGGLADDGRPYMVMEFVAGLPITDYCAQVHANLRQRLELFMQVCDAVAYAHRNLVVHRDLKPSNILVTGDGQVKLLDFGIAKLIDDQRQQFTQTAAAPLTLRSAAPEQITGGPITTATDIYALGLLLFELLTGSHPWTESAAPVLQALRAVRQQPAPAPSRVAADESDTPVPAAAIRGDLDAVVAKALRIEPAHRYQTVEAFKQDVDRSLRGEPVAAREGARLYVFGRFLRRYRWVTAGIVAIVLSLAIGLGIAAWEVQRTGIERDIARRNAAREEAVRYNLTRMFRSAISDSGAQPATAKSVIDSSATRVLREYRDQPELAGPLVLTLADLYGALEDVAGAAALLNGFVNSAGPASDPAVLADARQKLANIELLQGHLDRARSLLDQATTFWSLAPQKYPEERLEGLGIQAKLQRTAGDLDGAVATSREAIAQRIALSGHDHRETAILYNSLAITLAAANRLDEALAAYRETGAIYGAIGLSDGLDAQIILANTGTLELRTGQLREAEVLLKQAIERERALAGDSAAVGAAMGYYGRLLSITNRNTPAIATLREAVKLATQYTGANSPVSLQNRLFLGSAQLAAGDRAAARVTLDSAHQAALSQYGASHPLTLRTALALAQVAAAGGEDAAALAQSGEVIGAARRLGAMAEALLADALETQGTVELAENRTSSAVAALQEALSLRDKLHIHGLELLRTRERLGEALAGTASTATARALLQQTEHGLEVELGAEHPETMRAKAALAKLQSGPVIFSGPHSPADRLAPRS